MTIAENAPPVYRHFRNFIQARSVGPPAEYNSLIPGEGELPELGE